MVGDSGGDSFRVTGGQKIQESAAQHGEQQGTRSSPFLGVAHVYRLGCGEHGQPVIHGGPGEVGPGTVRVDQGARISLDPQRQQGTVLAGRQPMPDEEWGCAHR